jgi:hypothetical protein
MWGLVGLRGEIELSLVADAEDAHLGAVGHESVKRQIARLPDGNDELSDVYWCRTTATTGHASR